MFMMVFNLKQYWFLLVYFLTVSCFSPLTYAQLQLRLHPNEVVVLRKIAEKMGATLNQNLTVDPCQLQSLPIDDSGQSQSAGKGQNNTIDCSLTDRVDDDRFLHITTIALTSLSLPGMLPPEFANLTFLQTIDLTCNYLNGSLPKEWASLRHLKTISLTGNRLTGEIPPDWGNFANLTYLSLEANQLSGTIPNQLGNLVNLTVLILSSNQFVGSLPVALATIKNLKDLRVSDNSFNGTVPDFIGGWTNLERLEMYSSGLEGPIPTAIFDLGNLKDLRISDMIVPNFTFPNMSSKNIEILVLRNLNMSGSIPTDIWKIDNTLDLTFNNLGGEINSNEVEAHFNFLSGNVLTGNVPDSFLSSDDYIDLSYNSFTPLSSCPENRKINMYQSFSSNNSANARLSCPSRSSCKKYYQSLHINCGGADVIINNTRYEGDKVDETEGGATINYLSGNKWGFISVGDFMDDDNKNDDNDDRYTLSTDDTGVSKLYSTARVTPLFLSYYAYCMENGDYTVNLHFAEILFRDEEPYNRVGKRIFDIYIQGRLEYKDFNIKEIANGTGKEIKRSFNTTVTSHTLEIRLYWAGKGTTCIPIRGTYGPLISAISVCHGFKSNCDEPKNINNVSTVVGVVTSVLCIILCVVGFFCWRRYYGQKNKRELGTFTYRQLKAATNNFDSANKIGEGGFGSVFKGQLSDGTVIAVKQLSSKSRQGNREFVNEIGLISGLQHPNLVKLFGCCVAGNQLLLIYEYMENNCLAHALFGPNITLKLDWTTRQKICVGIARGIAFLHEGSTLRIVHRDIKATNVLLDKELNAKISDFGLAKLKEDDNTHISTRIAGTIGYMAPEYALWGYLTEKADVYSFGVVALEIVSGRNNANYRAESESVSLLDWALDLQQKENLLEIVDPKLEYMFNKEECERMIKVALLCCNDSTALRPTMSEVVCMLEAESNVHEVISDPSNYSTDFQSKPLKGQNQQIMRDQLSTGSTTSYFSSHETHRLQSSPTSADDLYPVNSESLRNLTSDHDLYPVSSEILSLKLGESSSDLHHCSLV